VSCPKIKSQRKNVLSASETEFDHIFRAYDIRGVFGEALTDDTIIRMKAKGLILSKREKAHYYKHVLTDLGFNTFKEIDKLTKG
jgi:hypothetical protein